jgi:hypothetical protein
VIAKAFGGDPNKAAGWLKARWYQLRGRPVPGTRGKSIHAALVDPDVLELAFFPISARKKLAAKGHAMPDGSFPIRHTGDLKNAIKAHGRAKNKEAVKRHIKKRAAALNAEHLLPEEWKKRKQTTSSSDTTLSLAFEEARHPRDPEGRFRAILGHLIAAERLINGGDRAGAMSRLGEAQRHADVSGSVSLRRVIPDAIGALQDGDSRSAATHVQVGRRYATNLANHARHQVHGAGTGTRTPPPGYTYDPELSDGLTAGFVDDHGDQVHIRRRDLQPGYVP